jgi:hypothetical protein
MLGRATTRAEPGGVFAQAAGRTLCAVIDTGAVAGIEAHGLVVAEATEGAFTAAEGVAAVFRSVARHRTRAVGGAEFAAAA